MNENFTIQREDPNAHERDFYRKLSQLPEELSKTWLDKYENLDDDAALFLEEFESFLQNRNRALSNTLEVHSDISEVIREEIMIVHESIKNTFGDTNYFLGNGRTAEVYILPVAPHLCTKYIKDQGAYNENNHMRVEYGFLDKLHAYEAYGVRTPRPYFIRIHPHEGHSYGMERIHGENLSRIIEKPSENRDLIRMLKSMEPEAVEKKLVDYIRSLHREFKISHNDLYRRNLMVDHDGNFYLIDFGKAKYEEIGEDHELFRNSDIAILVSEIRQFFEEIDKVDIT
jgi:tRNA A-37 threonylcarbamoyl transferase component Bud32